MTISSKQRRHFIGGCCCRQEDINRDKITDLKAKEREQNLNWEMIVSVPTHFYFETAQSCFSIHAALLLLQ